MSKEKEYLCSSCEHEKMCKFKKDFTAAEEEFYEKETEVNKKLTEDALVEVEVKCKFYSALKNIFTKKTIDITPSPFTPPYTITRDDPCENCEWHKSMLTRTTPYIGDSPCEWCIHNKFKATWSGGSANNIKLTSSESNSVEKDIRGLN